MTGAVANEDSIFQKEFFAGNDFFIDEKIMFFKSRNQYKVYDAYAHPVGGIVPKTNFSYKILRLFFKKTILPFKFHIVDEHQKTLVTIYRGWSLWMTRILIEDENAQPIGYIKQKFKLVSPKFKIFDKDRKLVAEINGDWKAWNFTIIDRHHIKIGEVNKQWNGIRRELFTTTDKFHVHIDPGPGKVIDKRLVVGTAVTIDMMLKELR